MIEIIILSLLIYFVIKIYLYKYFKSETFILLKNEIQDNTNKCNELNQHIEDLKYTYVKIDTNTTDNSDVAELHDNSDYNYKRPNLYKMQENSHTYNCSLSVCKNAKLHPFKYFCKYFNIKINEQTLENFEEVFNNFSAVEQGKILLKEEREDILNNISGKVPQFVFICFKERLMRELGFKPIDFSTLYFPKYTFMYVSSGGNSSMECNINFNLENLEKFINFLANTIKFKNSIAGQRALMTTELREKIKNRDNHTCKMCGVSTMNEPHLLLEIDHIIPLSKGGITSEENLQTLCWKCNRSKSNKILENINKNN